MNKIFTTQLTGLFQRLSTDDYGYQFEDAARLLSQAIIGEGSIYLYGSQELSAVLAEALNGVEPLPSVKELTLDNVKEMTIADRAWIFTREISQVKELTSMLEDNQIPFVVVANKEKNSDETVGDILIDLKVNRGLIPGETGERFGYPTGMASLFIYHQIHFLIREMLEEEE
ncbi:DUF2529 domain-containing protein [Bacillus carboniphilus]|uniref:DUF2529 domain-containing protein n=1 Tax=Bacillus carboniphilus TaxID=86663 RepID=A0ABN0VY28_9BACI